MKNREYEISRKIKEYEMKITKMAGYLADYYIDRAIESDDFSNISSYLIDYFSSASVGKSFDVGYLVAKYKEYELNEKIEDIDFDINEWYKVKYDIEHNAKELDTEQQHVITMDQDEYIQYMIDKRKKELEE
jgi:hypothetical protein